MTGGEPATTGAATRGAGKQRSIVGLLIVPAAGLVAGGLLLLRVRMEPPTVPAYTLASPADGGELLLGPTSQFQLDVAPASAVTGAVGARGFLVRGDEVRPWDPPFTVERDGTVHLAGTVATLFAGVPVGPWEVAVAVGRPENLPTAPRDVLRARDVHDAGASDAAWRLVRERVVLGG